MSRQLDSVTYAAKDKPSPVDSRLVTYRPSIWSHDFIASLEANFPSKWLERAKELEKKVLTTYFDHKENEGELLQVIDDIERLGVGYRFENDIVKVLASINEKNNGFEDKEDSLHMLSLRFRLLRQHGFQVFPDFVKRFKDDNGEFIVTEDIKGLLSLYEASYLAYEEETDLHEAKLSAREHLLKLKLNYKGEDNQVVNRSLELPLHRRMLRLEARWYIDACHYHKRKDANPLLQELAKLDFNMVQSALKTDLQQVSKWWKNIDLASKLSFVRDRLMECFFWMVGVVFEPQYHSCRVGLTKVCTLITVIDDIYDVYGSLEELQLFTTAVQRWDINAMKNMPQYLQIAFQDLHQTVTEMGEAQGACVTSILAKEWGDLAEAFLVEAKWTHTKCIPTLEDYLENAWRSASGVVILTHGYFLINQEIKNDTVESLEKYRHLMKWSSMIFRLCNDLGGSSEEIARGKTANAISCYMHEKGVSEEVARDYVKRLIDETWMKVTKDRVNCPHQDPFAELAINLGRASHCAYQYGDGHGAPDGRVKDQVMSVIIKPFTI